MKIRSSRISTSIARAISRRYTATNAGVLRAILSFFRIFKLVLSRYRAVDFLALRREDWGMDEDEYATSFRTPEQDQGAHDEETANASTSGSRRKGKNKEEIAELIPVGDLGYSGSTFFTTPNAKYLVKSLPRSFEHQFFVKELLDPYLVHMKNEPNSLLVRITDLIFANHASLGGILGLAPTHHIVMENLLFGKDAESDDALRDKWETYDLKPNDYFFPERDIADGKLAPESVKNKLIDEFPDKVRVTAEQKRLLMDHLRSDSKLLADHNAVDYSLFLVRYPGPSELDRSQPVPMVQSKADEWRQGVEDVDGKWIYRVVVLDFFWAKHTLRARTMTNLVKMFNKLAHKGPMSITADPSEYRGRFLKMVDEMVVVP